MTCCGGFAGERLSCLPPDLNTERNLPETPVEMGARVRKEICVYESDKVQSNAESREGRNTPS